jgi:hypothetical protein
MVMEKLKEELSALHDGEMDELGAMRVLRALDQNAQLLDEWELFSVIGESLRQNEPLSNLGMQGAQRALAVIAAEQSSQKFQDKKMPSRRWVPLALAASLTLLAIGLSLQPFSEPVRVVASSLVDPGHFVVADSRLSDPAEIDRYVDLHREVAVPGLQRATFISAESTEGPQGR